MEGSDLSGNEDISEETMQKMRVSAVTMKEDLEKAEKRGELNARTRRSFFRGFAEGFILIAGGYGLSETFKAVNRSVRGQREIKPRYETVNGREYSYVFYEGEKYYIIKERDAETRFLREDQCTFWTDGRVTYWESYCNDRFKNLEGISK